MTTLFSLSIQTTLLTKQNHNSIPKRSTKAVFVGILYVTRSAAFRTDLLPDD